jgi:hypothetical protein
MRARARVCGKGIHASLPSAPLPDMSSDFVTLLAALGSGVVLLVGFAVWWINRSPTFERTDGALPLFGGVTPGERVPAPAPEPRATRRLEPSSPAPYAAAPAPLSAAVPVAASAAPSAPAYASAYASAYATPYATAPSPAEAESPARPRPVIREFVSGVAPVAVAAAPLSAPESDVGVAPPVAPVVNADGVPGTMVEGHALRFSVPADGTLQFLPGRFEIGSGLDAGREIRFVRVDGPNGTEVTFGRADGELYRHIQLRDKTVSRAHARMHFDHGAWHLENLSQTNPVVHNGEAMPSSVSQRLSDGDRVEMGEVQFTFRER